MTGPGRYAPHVALTAMIAIWGGSYTAVKVALDTLPPFVVVAARFWLAVLCLLPFVRRGTGAELRRTAKPGLVAGTVLAAGYLLQTAGMEETSASLAGFLAGLIVLLVALGGFVFFRARLGARGVVGLLCGLCGLVLVCWPAGDAAGPPDTPRGIALQIASSTAYAGHILLLSRFGKDAPVAAFCLWQLGLTAVAATVAALLPGGGAAAATGVACTPQLAVAVLYLGVFATALGIGVQSRVQYRIPPTTLALLFALQPLFAALVAWAALGERLGAMQWLGGGAIVAGVLVTALDR